MPSIKVPVSWLRDYVDIPVSADDLAERLHMAGVEVDHVERSGTWDDKVWVSRIQGLEKHPNADKLQLATVEYGDGRRKTVVTGAFNIAEPEPVSTVTPASPVPPTVTAPEILYVVPAGVVAEASLE